MSNKVADTTVAVDKMAEAWHLAAALMGGTAAMRAMGAKYLYRWPNEDRGAYGDRLRAAVLFPAYSRSVQTLAAKPFSQPSTLSEDMGPFIRSLCENIDQQGRNLHAFAAECMNTAMGFGLGGILVDYPVVPARFKTLAQERAAGVRPYFVHIKPQQILGWRTASEGGRLQLTQLRIMEQVDEEDGDFGAVTVDQVRVLEPGYWRTYRKEQDGNWYIHKDGPTSLKVIPFVPFYGQRTGFMTGRPPLIELAHMNVKHWQSQSDQDTIEHVARVPILAAIGVSQTLDREGRPVPFQLTVGAGAAVDLPEGGDLKYVEHSGKAIAAGRQSLDDLKEEMRQAGAELLVIKPITTATQVHSENAVGMCALQWITLGLQDALNAALELAALWVGDRAPGTVTLFNDFGVSSLGEATATLIKDMAALGLLSKETAFKEQQRRGNITATTTWEIESSRMRTEAV